MEMFVVIGGIGLALASVVVVFAVCAWRRRDQNEDFVKVEQRVPREAEARRQAEEEARLAAEQQAQRQAEEAREPVEEQAGIAAEEEAQREAEEARRRAEERSAAQRQAEEARRQAEEEARLAAEQQAQRQAEEPPKEETCRVARAAAGHGERRQPEEAEPELPVTFEHPSQPRQEQVEAAEPPVREAFTRDDEAVALEAGSGVGPLPLSRRAPKYRPPSGAPTLARQAPAAAATRDSRPDGDEDPTSERGIRIEVRVLFDRGGCCRVTLLPKRRPDLPDDCAVLTASRVSFDLVALEDEWYQDVAPENLGALLRDGTVWTNQDTGQEWVLPGREIFVLAAGTTHRGFVSCPRLTLGREHAVICTTTNLAAVEDALRKAGCTNWTVFREEDGAPSGWVLISDTDSAGRPRGLVPTNAVPLEEASDILNVLRPLPEIEISLEGGVRLGYSAWLAGYPPAIRVLGDVQHVEKVLIDGKEATIGDDGACRAPGWDEPGPHQVWCSNVSRGYSLIRLERSWDPWPAYVFPPAGGTGDRIAICGPLVRPFADGEILEEAMNHFGGRGVLRTNPVLLGPVPGQVYVTVPRRDLSGALCFARPPFPVVWALPAQPLHCDKTANRILLVDNNGNGIAPDDSATAGAVSQWCRLILDASRKGLSVEPAAARDLWFQYKRVARNLWRKRR